MFTLSRYFLPNPLPKFGWPGLRRLRASLLLAFALSVGWAPAQAQFCPDPWSSATTVYGIVSLKGSGTASSTPYTQTINQSVLAQMKMVQQVVPCQWAAIPGNGIGMMTTTGSVNDTLAITGTCQDGEVETDYFTASGIGTIPSSSLGMSSFSNQYVFAADDAPNGTSGERGCANSSLPGPIGWGSEQTWPFFSLPPSAPVLFGTYSYASPAIDIGGSLNANWDLKWIFIPVPDPNCKPCHEHRGSDISTQDQSLGEDIAVAGTPFSLHYESSRSSGYAGTDLFALLDARNLGGWTLSVHHVLEPLLQLYCAGGGCTPYAVVPKALFLGDGSYRNAQDVQSWIPLNGNYYVTSEDGSEVYVFSPDGLHLQTVAPMTGALIYTFTYDSANRLIKVTDSNHNVTTIQRNATTGAPTAIVAPFLQKTKLAVDANGFLKQVTDPVGNIIKLTSSSLGLLSSYTDARGNVFTFQYDTNGRLTKDSDPVGGVINLARVENSSGNTVTKTTALGRASSYQTAFSTGAAQTAQTFSNTWENGLPASETDTQSSGQLSSTVALSDGSSFTSTRAPDPRWGMQLPVATSDTITKGNLTMNIAGSRTANFTAGDPFSLVTQTDTKTINGRFYKSVFTTASKTYVNISPAGRTITAVLDAQERISTIQGTGLVLNRFTYDTRGRLSAFTQGARKYTFMYATNGFLASITDPLLEKSTFTYDADGHLLSSTLPDTRVINDTVDANGYLASLTPPAGSAHGFAFSKVNLPVSYTPPAVSGSGSTAYAFDADRDFTKITRADGQVIGYTYDSAGRLTGLTTPTETINYAYSPTSGLVSSRSVSGGEAIAYTYNGPLRTSSQWTGNVAGTVSRTFDNNFWVSSRAVTGGATVSYTRDADGLITKAGTLTVRRSSTTGLVTGTTLNQTNDANINNIFAELTSYTAKYQTTPLYSAVITRDNLGRMVTNNETIGGTTTIYGYTYDISGRLTGVTHNGAPFSAYTYDPNSNRLTATTSTGTVNGAYDAQDRLLTYGNASYAYTADGELTSKTVASQTTSYQYDVLGNLTGVVLPNGSSIGYIIDGENNRVGKRVNGVLTAGYLYDGADIVAQLNGAGKMVSRFVYSGIGYAPDYMIRSGVTYRIFSDPLGSPRLVVNAATGAVVERIDYDEFGNVVNDTSPGFQPFGFVGGLYDQDTKLIRFGARDYDASTGRWTAKDPVLFESGDFNLYSYASNDPVNRTDISGNDASDVGMSVLEAYFVSIGMPHYTIGKMICKGLLQAQDEGLTKAAKDAAYKKATKNARPTDEYAVGVKESTKSAKDVGHFGSGARGVVNGVLDNQAGATEETQKKPCPNKCKSDPAAYVPDPKEQVGFREHAADAAKADKNY